MQALINKMLAAPAVRNRVWFGLRQEYYDELRIEVPIGQGLACPIVRRDYWHSFEEVFFTDEYIPVFEKIPLPERWLDLGCHAGFFSLLMILLRRRRGLSGKVSALLIDGDSRVDRSVRTMIQRNKLEGQLHFAAAAISAKPGELVFNEAEVMSSSISQSPSAQGRRVKVIRPEQIQASLPGPYDLIKIDVEGAEHDFLTSYQPTLALTKHLLLEWHSWHFGGGGADAIRDAAANAGFREMMEVVPSHPVGSDSTRTCGVVLFQQRR